MLRGEDISWQTIRNRKKSVTKCETWPRVHFLQVWPETFEIPARRMLLIWLIETLMHVRQRQRAVVVNEGCKTFTVHVTCSHNQAYKESSWKDQVFIESAHLKHTSPHAHFAQAARRRYLMTNNSKPKKKLDKVWGVTTCPLPARMAWNFRDPSSVHAEQQV